MDDPSLIKSSKRCPISSRSVTIVEQLQSIDRSTLHNQDCNDLNPLIRALAIRTMSYIPLPVIIEALLDPLRHCLKDKDPYVRKTAAICVAKLYVQDPKTVELHGFINMLRDLLADSNPTVVANAVAALTELSERSDSIILRLNLTVASKLISALEESSECLRPIPFIRLLLTACVLQVGTDIYTRLPSILCPPDSPGCGDPC
jgi:vesicle coat complex subunit